MYMSVLLLIFESADATTSLIGLSTTQDLDLMSKTRLRLRLARPRDDYVSFGWLSLLQSLMLNNGSISLAEPATHCICDLEQIGWILSVR